MEFGGRTAAPIVNLGLTGHPKPSITRSSKDRLPKVRFSATERDRLDGPAIVPGHDRAQMTVAHHVRLDDAHRAGRDQRCGPTRAIGAALVQRGDKVRVDAGRRKHGVGLRVIPEVIDGVPVFYSLGNYIFDQYFSTEVMEGLVLKLEVKPEPKVTLYPVSTAAGLSQPSLMEGNEKISFLHSLGQRSGDVASHIVQREIALPEWLAMRQKTAMITKQ